jgi:hypothetical protein
MGYSNELKLDFIEYDVKLKDSLIHIYKGNETAWGNRVITMPANQCSIGYELGESQ